MPRHLFYGNDYSNRPGSSYKMSNVIGQAADEMASMSTSMNMTSGKSGGASAQNNFSANKTQANTNTDS